jgi:hypothetical protein
MKIELYESGSISHRHGSAGLDPDPHQNVMDPQHCLLHILKINTSTEEYCEQHLK